MYKKRLCLGVGNFGVSTEEQIVLFKKAGFDGFFVEWQRGMDVSKLRKLADKEGMYFQSIHAPYTKTKYMWEDSIEADECLQELLECVKACAINNVPIMVLHAFIGFEDHSPNSIGLLNFEKVVNEAENSGVKIAFENTEGEEYLDALMEHFKDRKSVGFCWDTGHELCYNRGRDMMKSYGDRLICTHLNDNLGIKDANGKITWTDDLHLLPFDGVTCWESVTQRLKKYEYKGELTLELCMNSKPDRHENDKYGRMGLEEYLAEVYIRACRIATMLLNEELYVV